MTDDMLPEGYRRSVERPAIIIGMALRIVLAVALTIALIVKVYALVLTDYVCVTDEQTLGNLIRCTGVLEMIAGFVAIVAGLEAAIAFVVRSRRSLFTVLSLAVASALLALLSQVLEGADGWRLAIVTGVLALVLLALNLTAVRRAWRGD